jgi:hypothetical protein
MFCRTQKGIPLVCLKKSRSAVGHRNIEKSLGTRSIKTGISTETANSSCGYSKRIIFYPGIGSGSIQQSTSNRPQIVTLIFPMIASFDVISKLLVDFVSVFKFIISEHLNIFYKRYN